MNINTLDHKQQQEEKLNKDGVRKRENEKG